MSTRAFTFAGGEKGAFRVTRVAAVVGETLPSVSRIAIVPGIVPVGDERARWFLRGTTSNERYVARALARPSDGRESRGPPPRSFGKK